MEILMVFILFLVFAAVLTAVVSLIVIMVMAIMKKGLKIPLIILGSSVAAFFILVVGARGLDSYLSNVPNEPVVMDNNPTSTEEVVTEEEDTEVDLATEEIEQEPDEIDEIIAEADERIEQREQEEQEALDNRPDTSDLDNYRNDVDVRDIERNPDEYIHELIVFEGKIIQVVEDEQMASYRVAVNDDYDRIVLVSTLSSSLEERLLEDDYVTVYGEFTDLLTYETIVGGSRTVPSFVAAGERIILQDEILE